MACVSRLREMNCVLESILKGPGFLMSQDGPNHALQQWEEDALRADNESLTKWKTMVDKTPPDIDSKPLYEADHRGAFFDPLREKSMEHCEKWAQKHGGKCERGFDTDYYPMTFCVDGQGEIAGFNYLDSNVDQSKNPDEEDWEYQYPSMCDPYGTLYTHFHVTAPFQMLAPIIKQNKSRSIDLTILGKGYKDFNETRRPPYIPVLVPDRIGELGFDATVEPQEEEEPHEEEDPPPDLDFEGDTYYYGDNPEAPKLLNYEENLKSLSEITWPEGSDEKEEQIWYITGRNLDNYMKHLVDNPRFEAAAKKTEFAHGTLVRRIASWVFIKAHMVMACWDTMLDGEQRPFCHRLYICNNRPQDGLCYKNEFKGEKIIDSVLAAFYAALHGKGYIGVDGVPVELYNDTAFRAIFRRNFLMETAHGDDLNCNAYVHLCTLYLSLMVNPVFEFDDGKNDRPRFSTVGTKRFYRSEFISFQSRLREFVQSEIAVKGHAMWISPLMASEVVTFDDVDLISVHPESGEKETYAYKGAQLGFGCVGHVSKRSMNQR